jgi:hypothetical protein
MTVPPDALKKSCMNIEHPLAKRAMQPEFPQNFLQKFFYLTGSTAENEDTIQDQPQKVIAPNIRLALSYMQIQQGVNVLPNNLGDTNNSIAGSSLTCD